MPRTSTTSSRSSAKTSGKSAPRRAASKRSRTDVLSILQDDHKRVVKLFKQFEKADHQDAGALQAIAEQACGDIELHAALEEEIFYPALREAIDESDMEMMEEATVEHETAKQLIAQLRELEPADARYAATFTVLGEYIRHHVEEEEGDLFKHARRAKLDFEALGERLQERRAELQSESRSSAAVEDGSAGGKKARQIPREAR